MSGTINQLRTVSNSGKIKSSHTMGISDAWSQPLWVVTVEITHQTKDRLRINWLDAPHSFTKTFKHWASIHNKQITIQPLTRNLSDHELTTRTLEPFLPRNWKTRANKQRHTKPIWASTSQQQSRSFETRQEQLRHMPTTSYLSLDTGDNQIWSQQWLAHLCCHADHWYWQT